MECGVLSSLGEVEATIELQDVGVAYWYSPV